MATALAFNVFNFLLVQRALQRKEHYVELSGSPRELTNILVVQDVVLAPHNESKPPTHRDTL